MGSIKQMNLFTHDVHLTVWIHELALLDQLAHCPHSSGLNRNGIARFDYSAVTCIRWVSNPIPQQTDYAWVDYGHVIATHQRY